MTLTLSPQVESTIELENPPATQNPPTYPDNPERVLVVGDMHGNLFAWQRTIMKAYKQSRAEVILQVGDFGYGWDDLYLYELDAILEAAGATVLWLDGNHENFDKLEMAGAFPSHKGVNEPTQTSERTWYLPRGYVWDWHGRKCLALGGAYSVDKPYRTPHRSWWPQEEITEDDVTIALRGIKDYGHGDGDPQPIDVMFTHDAFDGIRVPGVHAEWKQDEFAEVCFPNREKLRRVVDVARPELLCLGHFHHSYVKTSWPGIKTIVGLNCESEQGSAILLEFPSLEWSVA